MKRLLVRMTLLGYRIFSRSLLSLISFCSSILLPDAPIEDDIGKFGIDDEGECVSEGKLMDGYEEVISDGMSSHFSCFEDSGGLENVDDGSACNETPKTRLPFLEDICLC